MDAPMMEELLQEAQAAAAPPADDVGAGPGGAALPVIDPADEWKAALSVLILVATPMLPFLPTIYTDDAVMALARAIVPVAEKYGWNGSDFFAKWGPEIGLAMTAAPLAMQTARAWKAMQDAKQAESAAQKPAVQKNAE